MAKDNKVASMPEITIGQAQFILEHLYESGKHHQNVHFAGQPGIGKTATPRAVAEKLRAKYPDFKCIVIAPATMDPLDVGGIPWPKDNTAQYLLPEWFPTDPEERGFLVLDDMSQAQGDMQKVLANLMHERELRGHKLPKGYMVVSTGNRLEDRSGVVRSFGHLSNRRTEFHVMGDVKTWTGWAIKNGVREEVIGFLTFNAEQFCDYDAGREQNPTPRSWVFVSEWLDIIDNMPKGTGKNVAIAAFAGAVGPGAATMFYGFYELFGKLPDLDDVLKAPKTFSIDYKLDTRYALTIALSGKMDGNNLGKCADYLDRYGPDFSWLAIQMALARKGDIIAPGSQSMKDFTKWANEHQSIVSGNY